MSKAGNVDAYAPGKPNPLDTYLKVNGYTRYKLAQSAGISNNTLLHVARRKVENMEAKYFIFIGVLINKDPANVFADLLKTQAEIDEKAGIIE